MSPREIIASALGVDIASITPYQSGQTRRKRWQDGEDVYAVQKTRPPEGRWTVHDGQGYAARANTVMWRRIAPED